MVKTYVVLSLAVNEVDVAVVAMMGKPEHDEPFTVQATSYDARSEAVLDHWIRRVVPLTTHPELEYDELHWGIVVEISGGVVSNGGEADEDPPPEEAPLYVPQYALSGVDG
jgi:hypothetical protein